ncbi:MAG: DUF4248 domain-containing protein [Bacteroides sp.]|nr:DUF4248 domain-containing protein [Bacteroides sp.]
MKQEENRFLVHTYTKSELAHLYNPQMTVKNATQVLRRWIQRNQELHKALISMGYTDRSRSFTPRQVQLIVDTLGEP